MRISGGAARGVSLLVPAGDAVRPATDGMRQSLFSSLASWVPNARFLDLFAGSGSYGLEALSRGARGGVFVERSAKALQCLERNLAAVAKSARLDPACARIAPVDATNVPWPLEGTPDLVFIDPPYERIEEHAAALFSRLAALVPPTGGTLVCFEMPGELVLSPPGWREAKRIGKGARQPTVAIFRRDAP